MSPTWKIKIVRAIRFSCSHRIHRIRNAQKKRERFHAAARELKREAVERERVRKLRIQARTVLSRFVRTIKLRMGVRRVAKQSLDRIEASVRIQCLWRQHVAKQDLQYRLDTMRAIMDVESERKGDFEKTEEQRFKNKEDTVANTTEDTIGYGTPERSATDMALGTHFEEHNPELLYTTCLT